MGTKRQFFTRSAAAVGNSTGVSVLEVLCKFTRGTEKVTEQNQNGKQKRPTPYIIQKIVNKLAKDYFE